MKYSALFCLGVALLAGCQKDDDIVTCGPATPATFADLRAAAPAVQSFTFNLGQAQSFRTSAGATVAFPANAFMLANGSLATGQAVLRVREIYSVPDMILANMPTTAQSSRQMLVSGGEFNFQVWQGSTRLRMGYIPSIGAVNRLSLTSPVPTVGLDTTRMMLWNQLASPLAGTPADSSGWQQVFTSSQSPVSSFTPVVVPAVAGNFTTAIPLDSIGNWNIDQFWHAYQTAARGNVEVEVPGTSTATNTRVYFRPVGFNGLARCYGLSASRWYTYLPYGADMIAVVLQERDGLLYYGTQRVTTAAGMVVTPALQVLSAAEIIQRIRQL